MPRRGFSWPNEGEENTTDAEPPDARGALEGTRDRQAGRDPRLPAGRRAHLPGQDRQDALPGAAPGDRRRRAAALAAAVTPSPWRANAPATSSACRRRP